MARTIVITGGSGGIGTAIAAGFAKMGDSVVVGSFRNLPAAKTLCARLTKEGLNATALCADVTDTAQVDAFFSAAEALYGPVDVLVNNAGIAQQKLFCDITDEDWRQMLDVHVTGSFLCCRRVLPGMIRRKTGSIVNISSMWGQVGASCEVHYSVAKSAIIGLTKALAQEVAPSNIRVNCVAPGAVDTAMLNGLSAKGKQALCEEIPLGRLGTPEEIAAAVLFLAGDSASYFTGQVLAPNGGMVV